MKIDRETKPARAVLPNVLDLSEAENLLSALRSLQVANEPYAVDGSEVTRVSTACLQILLVAAKGASPVNLVAPSLPLLEAIEDLGLTKYFEERIVLE